MRQFFDGMKNQGYFCIIFKQKFKKKNHFFRKNSIFFLEFFWNNHFLRMRLRNEEFLLSSATFSLIEDESCFAESPNFFSRVPSWAFDRRWICGPEFLRRSFWRSSSAFLKEIRETQFCVVNISQDLPVPE